MFNVPFMGAVLPFTQKRAFMFHCSSSAPQFRQISEKCGSEGISLSIFHS